MPSRSFLAGLLVVLVPAAAVGAVLALSSAGDDARPRVTSVQVTPPLVPGGGRTQPLSPTPTLPGARASHEYAMPTAAGNAAVDGLVTDVRQALRARRLKTAAAVEAALGLGLSTLAAKGFRDVYDAPVRRAIGRALDRDLQRAGIDPDDVAVG